MTARVIIHHPFVRISAGCSSFNSIKRFSDNVLNHCRCVCVLYCIIHTSLVFFSFVLTLILLCENNYTYLNNVSEVNNNYFFILLTECIYCLVSLNWQDERRRCVDAKDINTSSSNFTALQVLRDLNRVRKTSELHHWKQTTVATFGVFPCWVVSLEQRVYIIN